MTAVTPQVGRFGSPSWVFLVDGFNMLAAKVQGLAYKLGVVHESGHGGGDAWAENVATGDRFVEITQDGAFWRTDPGGSHDALKDTATAADPNGAARLAVVGFAGNAIGQPVIGFEGLLESEYEPTVELKKLHRANAKHTVTGKATNGVILHALAAETADGNTEGTCVDGATEPQRVVPISTSVALGDVVNTTVPHGLVAGGTVVISGHAGSTPAINGEQSVVTVPSPTSFTIGVDITVGGTGGTLVQAKTNSGGEAHLQVSDHVLGGFTGADVKLRHSDDAAVFVDLVAFASETLTRHAQRIVIGGPVRRYLAQALDRTGAGPGGSITYLAAFCRYR